MKVGISSWGEYKMHTSLKAGWAHPEPEHVHASVATAPRSPLIYFFLINWCVSTRKGLVHGLIFNWWIDLINYLSLFFFPSWPSPILPGTHQCNPNCWQKQDESKDKRWRWVFGSRAGCLLRVHHCWEDSKEPESFIMSERKEQSNERLLRWCCRVPRVINQPERESKQTGAKNLFLCWILSLLCLSLEAFGESKSLLLYKTFAVKFRFLSRLFCLNQNDFIFF